GLRRQRGVSYSRGKEEKVLRGEFRGALHLRAQRDQRNAGLATRHPQSPPRGPRISAVHRPDPAAGNESDTDFGAAGWGKEAGKKVSRRTSSLKAPLH